MAAVKAQSYLSTEVAMLASLVLHVLAFLSWQNRVALGHFPLFRPLAKIFASTPARSKPAAVTPTLTFLQAPAPQRAEEDRRQFIETDASQVTGEEPKHAQFYSAQSTIAANPNNLSGKTGDTPYLDGQETRLTSTENVRPQPPSITSVSVPRPVTSPAVAPVTPAQVASKPVEPVKEMAETGLKVVEEKQVAKLDKPGLQPESISSPPPQSSRPQPLLAGSGSGREIAAVKSRATTMGVSRIGITAFNVAGSPFGEYDKALIFAVQNRWYALLDENRRKQTNLPTGTVVLQFDLRADGSVANMTTKSDSSGPVAESFCREAIEGSAPFAPLSESLQRLIGGDPREIVFTFYY